MAAQKMKFAGLVLGALATVLLSACREATSVTVYTSVDRSFSEPVLAAFEDATGIQIEALYDVEATKTTGLASRLVAEADRPRADVFWNGELVQTQRLAAQGILEADWVTFGGRVRVLIVNTDRLEPDDYPSQVADFLSNRWPADQTAIAHPLFGTSATHAGALFALWGMPRGEAFYRDAKEAGVQIVDGNSVVRDMAVRGEILFGLTDTDDACGAVAQGAPVAVLFPDQDGMGALVIPNSAARVRGAPHPESADQLIAWLQGDEAAEILFDAGWFHVIGKDVPEANACDLPGKVVAMEVPAAALVAGFDQAQRMLRQTLVR